MIKFDFQNPAQNDIWREIIKFCMSKPQDTSPEALQYMVAKELGYEASTTACALAAIRFQEILIMGMSTKIKGEEIACEFFNVPRNEFVAQAWTICKKNNELHRAAIEHYDVIQKELEIYNVTTKTK